MKTSRILEGALEEVGEKVEGGEDRMEECRCFILTVIHMICHPDVQQPQVGLRRHAFNVEWYVLTISGWAVCGSITNDSRIQQNTNLFGLSVFCLLNAKKRTCFTDPYSYTFYHPHISYCSMRRVLRQWPKRKAKLAKKRSQNESQDTSVTSDSSLPLA